MPSTVYEVYAVRSVSVTNGVRAQALIAVQTIQTIPPRTLLSLNNVSERVGTDAHQDTTVLNI